MTGEYGGSAGVVAAIEPKLPAGRQQRGKRPVLYALQARRPAHAAQAAADGIDVHDAGRWQTSRAGDGEAAVLERMRAHGSPPPPRPAAPPRYRQRLP